MNKPAWFINPTAINHLNHWKMKYHLAAFSILLIIVQYSYGQSALNLPKDNPQTAKEKYVILSDNHDSKNPAAYKEAYKSLHWIIDHAPDLHESVYIFGIKLLKTKIEKEPQKASHKDELMELYDLRIKYFGNDLKVLHRKAYDAFQYLRKDTSKLDQIDNLFDYLYQKEMEDFETNLIYPYFIIKISRLKAGKITNRELIENYQDINVIIQSKRVQSDSVMEKIQKLVDANLVKYANISCDSIDDLLMLEDNINSMNLQQAELVIKLSINFECTDSPVFIKAIKVLHEDKPGYKLAKLIGGYHLGRSEYPLAIDFLSQALDLANDDEQRAELYFDLAKTYLLAKNYIKAREMAQLSLKCKSDNPDCYRLIGDMYYNSFDECKKGKSHVEDRSIFYAAYEKYAQVGDTGKMANAEQQFPTMEQIHTENYKEGQVINTGCWINENVKIRRKPNLVKN